MLDQHTRTTLKNQLLFWDTYREMYGQCPINDHNFDTRAERVVRAIDAPRAAAGLPPLVDMLPLLYRY